MYINSILISHEVLEGSTGTVLPILYPLLSRCMTCATCIRNINGVKNKNESIAYHVRKLLLHVPIFQMIKLRPGEIPKPVSDNSAICLIIKSVPLVTACCSHDRPLGVLGNKKAPRSRVGIIILGSLVDWNWIFMKDKSFEPQLAC